MNIVIFTMSLKKGGAERVITNLCNQYLVKKNKATIITCVNASPEYSLDSDICHICLDDCEDGQKQNKLIRFIRRRKKLKQILDSLRADILLSVLPEPSFLILSLRKWCQYPIIVSVRSDPAMEYTFLPYRFMMKLLYPRADGFIMQTEEAKAYFPQIIQAKAIVLPNPINQEAVKETFDGERRKEIVAVGRLIKEKNYPLLIRAFQRIHERFPEYNLMIYGEGPLREELTEYIRKMKLEEKVFLAGAKNDIFDRIYESSLFIMTSSHEGMPNALMEAMALGLPVIATDCPCGGPRFLIQDQYNGLLVEVDNEKALTEAVELVLSDKEFAKKLGRNAGKIAETLAPEKIYEQWGIYISRIVNEGREKNE